MYRRKIGSWLLLMIISYVLVALFIWLAENLGTFTRVWMYPTQHRAWHLVPPEKIGSWLLLMIISYVLVSALYRRTLPGTVPAQKG